MYRYQLGRLYFPSVFQQAQTSFPSDLKKLASLALGLALLLNVIAALSLLVLYLDGAHYFFGVLQKNSFFLREPSARTVQVLQQLPILISSRLGMTSVDSLLIVGGLSNLLLPLALTALCYWILPREHKALFIFPLFHYLGGSLASWAPTVTDAPPAVAYFWVLFYWILFRPGRGWSGLVLILLSAPALYLHEALSFLGFFLILAGLWRIRASQDRFQKLTFSIASVWYGFVVYTAIRFIIAPRSPSNKAGFITTLTEWKWVYWDGANIAVIGSAIVAALMIGFWLANLSGNTSPVARWARKITPFAVGGLVVAALLALAMGHGEYGIWTQFPARAQAAFISVPLAAVALLSVAYPSITRAWQDRVIVILLGLLAVAVLGWHSIGLTVWRDYVRDFRAVLSSSTGYVSFDEGLARVPPERRAVFQRLSSVWTNPTISYLLSPAQRVSTILGNPPGQRWQPFNPCNTNTLPRRKFDTEPYLAAIGTHGCDGMPPLGRDQLFAAISFATGHQAGPIAEVIGLSHPEGWGRWSDSDRITIQFKRELPTKFDLLLRVHAFGPNVDAPVTVLAGEAQASFTPTSVPRIYRLSFAVSEPTDSLTILIPHPTRPIYVGLNEDTRRLGLGFKALQVRETF